MKNKFVDVVLPLPVEKNFSYLIPREISADLKKGLRVKVPFGKREMIGIVINAGQDSQISSLKSITKVIDDNPLISEKMFRLAEKISFDCAGSLGEVLKNFFPIGVNKHTAVDIKDDKNKEISREELSVVPEVFAQISGEIREKIELDKFSLNAVCGLSFKERSTVYLEIIKTVLENGKSCLLLVPDIGSIEPLEDFFRRWLKEEKIFSFHSRLKNKEKNARWFLAGEEKVLVIGTPHSVFLPFRDLGLVIIEEEIESSYKQRNSPYLNLKDTAVKRAEIENCPVILAGAFLSAENFYKIQKSKKTRYFDLKSFRDKTETQVVDLNRVFPKTAFFSKALELKISNCLKENKKVFIFMNRKGFATYLYCPQCGYVNKCPNCRLPLVYYYARKKLVCNSCFYEESVSNLCPQCRKNYFKFSGAGIEKIESETARIFPRARIQILSADEEDDGHFEHIIKKYDRGEIDILIATQVLAKRPHRAKAELVILAFADTAFNAPDFRAGEKLFDLISRMKNLVKPGGFFVVQTLSPDTVAVKSALTEDTDAFYKEELENRKQLNLPPFAKLVQIRISSLNEDTALKGAKNIEEFLKKENARGIEITRAAPSFYSKLKGRYRYNIVMSGKDEKELLVLTRKAKKDFRKSGNLRITFDVDPQELL
ncbi:MAG: primosomal protein N' [Candidatus Omnitrophota bacterium]